MRRANTNGIRRNNWPPLPEKCCFQPCFYQDIAVEIPIEFQKIVRHLYYLWMCKFFCFFFTILKKKWSLNILLTIDSLCTCDVHQHSGRNDTDVSQRQVRRIWFGYYVCILVYSPIVSMLVSTLKYSKTIRRLINIDE